MAIETTAKIEQSKQRIVEFDIIRGYFLFVILIDHLGRFFGFWEIFTGRGAQWVSAAEGFFFVSGIMIGMLRGRKMISEPLSLVVRRLWSRAGLLYLWGVGLSLAFSFIAINFSDLEGLKGGIYNAGSSWEMVKDTLTLNFFYGWGDFLGYYSVYLFFAPLAIWLIRKRLWPILLWISVMIWAITSTIMGSWQILFYSGLIAGYYYEEIKVWTNSLSKSIKRNLIGLIYGLSLITLALSLYFTTLAVEFAERGDNFSLLGINFSAAKEYGTAVLGPYFNKPSLGIGRLILFFVWFSALFLFINKYQERLKNTVGRVLIPLGQNSLYVYIMHAILLFTMDLIIPDATAWPVNVLINTVFVLTVVYLVKIKFLFKIIPR